MVKAGFVVEGTSDFIVIKSEKFIKYLHHVHSIETNEESILIAGCQSNIKTNLKSFLNKLNKSVDYIFIMVDQDDKEAQKRNRKYRPPDCPIQVINEIKNYRDNRHYIEENQTFIIMTREFEAWLLADNGLGFNFQGNPDEILSPSDVVAKQLGTSSHVKIANRIKDKFSLERAAENSGSANRFLRKLRLISQ